LIVELGLQKARSGEPSPLEGTVAHGISVLSGIPAVSGRG